MQALYTTAQRELKRLDSTCMSPIFSHFSETLAGLVSLRAFKRQDAFHLHNARLLDASNRVFWAMQNVCHTACYLSMLPTG